MKRAHDSVVLQVIEGPQQHAQSKRPVIPIIVVLVGEQRPAIERKSITIEDLTGETHQDLVVDQRCIEHRGRGQGLGAYFAEVPTSGARPAATCTLSRS